MISALIINTVFNSKNKFKVIIYQDAISMHYETLLIKFDQKRDIVKCCNNTWK